jgi:DNA repair protein SbcC/Rad50
MIKEISIQNFQSHKQTTISFVDGLNVITGSSDSGKSSVLRALLWVVNNRPSGDSIKNWNSSPKDVVHVQLVADNFLINKSRFNGKSTYNYKNGEGDSIYYDAIKTDVPEEITEQLNLSEFNIQTQHQPYFLLNDSGGEIAKKLNDLVGLSVIDTIFKNLNSSILRTDRELHETELSIKEIDESIDSLAYLDSVMGEVDSLTLLVKEYEEIMESAFVISSSLESYNTVEKEFKTYEKFLLIEEKADYLKEKIYELSNLTKNRNEVEGFIDDYEDLKSYIKSWNRQCIQLGREYKNLIKDNPVCPILKTVCKELENYGT